MDITGVTVGFDFLRTKRTFILVLVTTAAVLGGGFGILPGLLDESNDATEPPTTESLTTETTATEQRSDETTTERVEKATPTRTTATESWTEVTQKRSSAETVSSTTTSDESDGEFTQTTSDEVAETDLEVEGNVTIGSLSNYPSNSRRLNAVVNPPNAARTAGGA